LEDDRVCNPGIEIGRNCPRVPTSHIQKLSDTFERTGVRLLTAVAILGLCSVAIVRGWSIVRFVDARAHFAAHKIGGEELRSWDTAPGLRDAALQISSTSIAGMTDVDGARRRADDLSELLSIQPLSSVNWLSLSGMRLVAGQSETEVLSALEMSWVTGPNEGNIMLQRGVFGILLWETLPPDARRRVIDDVAGAILGTPVGDSELNVVKNVLGEKSVDIRQEIASLMRARSVPASQLARLGL
jgi:hypothetical protein